MKSALAPKRCAAKPYDQTHQCVLREAHDSPNHVILLRGHYYQVTPKGLIRTAR